MGQWDEYAIVLGLCGSLLGGTTLVATPHSNVARWFRVLDGPPDPIAIALAIGGLGALLTLNMIARRRWLATHLHEPLSVGGTSYRTAFRQQGWRWQPLWWKRSGLALMAFSAATVMLALRTAEGTAAFVAASGVSAGAAWAYSRWGGGVAWFLPLLTLATLTASFTESVSAALIPFGLLAVCTLVAFASEAGRALRSWDEASRIDEEPSPV